MSRSSTATVVGLAFAVSLIGAGQASAAPAEDPKAPVCVGVSVAGLDLNQLCQK
ncbi:MAG: hypothetical protein ACT4QF_24385 [Sporichthyaceae bacterium]|jgi:hypothetical protein